MSYDLMVFDPDIAPRKGDIGEWYGDVMEGDGNGDSSDPTSGQSVRLKAFYDEMRVGFPAMNGPDQTTEFDNERVTGYDFYPGFIYMDFRWSASKAAGPAVLACARTHGVGLYDPQGAEVVLTGVRTGESSGRTSWWRRLFGG